MPQPKANFESDSYIHFSSFSLMLYAMEHGYDYYRIVLPYHETRSASWSRVVVPRPFLKNYDWVLYIDGDCSFNQPNVRLETLLEQNGVLNNTNKLFLFPRDADGAYNFINAGVMFMSQRNNGKLLFDILQEWWDIPLKMPQYARFTADWPCEQHMLHEVIRHKYKDNIAIADDGTMTGPNGTIISHSWSGGQDKLVRTNHIAVLTGKHVFYFFTKHFNNMRATSKTLLSIMSDVVNYKNNAKV